MLLVAPGAVIWLVCHQLSEIITPIKPSLSSPETAAKARSLSRFKDSLKAVPGFKLAAENENMALYLKEKTAEVAVYDKATGNTVYSNPPAADKDPVAKASNLENLKSQFILSYLDGNAKEGTPWTPTPSRFRPARSPLNPLKTASA